MSYVLSLFPPSHQFWTQCARHIIKTKIQGHAELDFSAWRIIVPAFEHAQWLMRAMNDEIGVRFISPRINTLSAWLENVIPPIATPISPSERLMSLYAQLREHAWLKKLFSAQKNTDLLPLAHTLITLSDELTLAMLPRVGDISDKKNIEQHWRQALAQLPMPAQQLVSDEAHLVWRIWQSQLDGQDAISLHFQRLLQLAQLAPDPLIWINPVQPEGVEQQFLTAYAAKQEVQAMSLDWRSAALKSVLVCAWSELLDETSGVEASVVPAGTADLTISPPRNYLATLAANSLEQEAQLGAQTIVQWLQQGQSSIGLIAQDRVVARRIGALLERAHVQMSDETGWKLSTTRAAAALAAWLDVVLTKAETVALLDLLKSPYFAPDAIAEGEEKTAWLMSLERTLLRANVMGGWDAMLGAVEQSPDCAQYCLAFCTQLKCAAQQYSQRKTLSAWLTLTQQDLIDFGIDKSWRSDVAGQQVIQLLEQIQRDCVAVTDVFSFIEWRAFMNSQLESAMFYADQTDQRVVMLPLNGARLRQFDAVLMVGCDAAHLPSPSEERLFFTNAVRRECGLVTREQYQRQQLRDFAALLAMNRNVVLTWQRVQHGEPNPVSPWIERLNLCLQQAGQQALPAHEAPLSTRTLPVIKVQQPRPVAPCLAPTQLSASGYNSFIACPYQFFAARMLGLSSWEELSDLPEKRDYGVWAHAILEKYHHALKAQPHLYPPDKQVELLTTISRNLFAQVLVSYPAALGYSQRWEKIIPLYVAWAQRYAQSDWEFEMAEVWLEKTLQWEGGQITLHGKIDRIDKHHEGEYAVLDYKTMTQATLTKKLQSAEDHQLPFYGLLAESSNRTISSAHYVALEQTYEKISHVSAPDYLTWRQELKSAIVLQMTAIQQGSALPAQGINQVCQYCEVRGLCRKGAW
jgi:ATP-dependent helicase/nuclease subunit B